MKKKPTKRLGLSPENADRMTVFLHSEPLVTALNIIMRARKVMFELNYEDHSPVLMISTPGKQPEVLMICDTRRQISYAVDPRDQEYLLVKQLIQDLLIKHDAYFALVTRYIKKTKGKEAVLQVILKDSRLIALTLMATKRGTKLQDTDFCV